MSTITACSTSLPAAIAIIRISGEKTKALLKGCFFPLEKKIKEFESHKIMTGTLIIGEIKDKAMAVFFASPKTFTGEDMAEIYVHGSRAIIESLLKHLVENGARPAKNGEFSRRAFLNGKLDLSSAEGIINLVNAETENEAKAAYSLMNGELKNKIDGLQAELRTVIAEVSAAVDYPEEDLEASTRQSAQKSLEKIQKELQELKSSYKSGKLVKNGVRITVFGDVNVGKSSLVNALLKKNRAIVARVAGTTRDTLEDVFEYKGYRFILTDTAGVRDTPDEIEEQGIKRAKNAANSSDIVLFVNEFDNKNQESQAQNALKNLAPHIKIIEVVNKIDLCDESFGEKDGKQSKNKIYVSALKNINIDLLREAVYNITVEAPADGLVLIELRHFEAVQKAYDAVCEALLPADIDCLLSLILAAYDSLGEVTGEKGSERIIEEIFSKFCVGK